MSGLLWGVTTVFTVLFVFFYFQAYRGGGIKDPGDEIAFSLMFAIVSGIVLSIALVSALVATVWQLTHRSHAHIAEATQKTE